MKSGFKKKGFVQNFILPVIIILVVVFAVIIAGTVQKEFNEEIQQNDAFSEISKETTQNFTDGYAGMTDNFAPIVLIVYMIISILSAIAIRMSPIFIFITVFLVLGMLIFPMLASNIYVDFVASDDITIENQFPITHFILTNFPIIYIGYILVIALTWVFADRF